MVRKPRVASRQLLLLLVVFTLGLAAALVWLGTRLIRQDRNMESQRVREHLDRAGAIVAAELQQRLASLVARLDGAAMLSASERRVVLSRWGDSLDAGELLVEVGPDAVQAYPPGRLRFDPSWTPEPSALDPAFQSGEYLEFQRRDLEAAATAYRVIAGSDGPGRVGALLRLGRVQRKAGALESALETYHRMAREEPVNLEGRPADLVARHARLDLLDQLGRSGEAEQEARDLYLDLTRGRWRLSRGGFEFVDADLRRRIAGFADSVAGAPASATSILLTRALDSLWREWRRGGFTGTTQRLLDFDGLPVVVASAGPGATHLAWLATPSHLAGAWLQALEPVLAREGVWLTLESPAGVRVVSQIPAGSGPVVRAVADPSVPWVLALASRDPARAAEDLAARRRVLIAGLFLASLLGLVGTYAVARAVNRELEVARVQSDFVAAVSHEFRTPLTSIRQLTELLASGRVPGDDRRKDYYELMKQESLRLHRLVEGLLDFGRMEAGAHQLRLEPMEAAELVRGVVSEFQEEAAGRERRIELRDPAPQCPVRADREALGRALWNLLDNAVKYSPEGAPVTVSLARTDGKVSISISDRGPGIPPGEQDRVFEKFIRGDAARASGIRGTGLGLAMVREIARAHRGEVSVKSTPGAGSTFTLALPVAEADA